MSRTNAPHGRVGRPPVTSRTQILTAARRLIDQDGWEQLTIRKLAAEIGIGATTLYHHVRNKEDLLFLLIHEYAEQIPHPDLPSEPSGRIVAASKAIHDALAAWPWAAEVLATDGFIARLGESALWLVETMVAGAIEHGCTPEQAVHIFRNIWYYTVGEILVRAHSSRPREDYERSTDRKTALGSLDASRLPHLAALDGQWASLSWEDTYPQALKAFVDGLLAQATATPPKVRPGV
ncbi:TetR/AcrR family transcriptional regulator [Streptomyces sp. NPDC058439]|uniref:TetR/AcrR family transcriptional regulator n=1 Tax=Streptomyces sp. NPDC058439 TaxID=3346500 RepID=UPI003666F3E7